MTLDIGSYINKLLYQHDSVVIPGLGALVASYKPSHIDHVQGLLHPPSKLLAFDQNLLENDDILINFVHQYNQLPKEEAAELVATFVEQVMTALEKREIVVFENVGRLYKDYEQKLQFLQDHTNFNTQTFGLPSIQFYPILRSKSSIFEGNEAPGPIAFEVQHESKARKWKIGKKDLQNAVPAFFLLMIAFCAVYFFINRNEERFLEAQKVPVSDTRINTKPTLDRASFMDGFETRQEGETTILPEKELEEIPPAKVDKDGAFETEIDTESITLGPSQKEGIVIIGAFSKKAGVTKRIRQIYELGYDVYQDKVKNLTRVGIQFAYETEREKKKILSIMKEEFDTSAYLLEE